jgi:predicted PurR-regulated permease PerM
MSDDPQRRAEPEPLTDRHLFDDEEAPPRPLDVPPAVLPRWVQLTLLPLAILGSWVVLRAAGKLVLIFALAVVLALILNPLVTTLQRVRLPRGVAILLVYLSLFALLGLGGYLLANPVSTQLQSFQKDVPKITRQANQRLADLQKYFDRKHINLKIKEQGHTALQTLQKRVIGGTDKIVAFGTGVLEKVVAAGIALVLILVLSVYLLIYGERIGGLVRAVLPPGDGTPEDDYPTRVQRAVAGYVRGQLLFSVAMGTGAAVGLYVFGLLGIFPDGRTYALAFGIFFGVAELIPFVGPFLGALPPVLVALFQDPLTALWVALLFLALQQIEGHIVAPNVFGRTLRINPVLVILALLLGGEAFGIVGALVALPIAAIVRETIIYLRRHVVLEPWGTMSPLQVLAIRRRHAEGPATEPCCQVCGTPADPDDAYCRSCGARLARPPVPSPR